MPLQLQSNRLLSEFSTFGIGGPARYFAEISSISEMKEAFLFAKAEKVPFHILGKGSNSLFDDRGYNGLAILNKIDFCDFYENGVRVGSGHSFSHLGVSSARKGFSGLEFASGIPATVGGAVFMNAGANGQEICNPLLSVSFLHEDGREQVFQRSELTFSYRTSSFQMMKGVILAAEFALKPSQEARRDQLKILDYRLKTQPYKDKSAGCAFRNPEAKISAGALIDRCGLKGFRVGGAEVSTLHGNFIINAGSATAKDILSLMQIVQERVFKETQVHLEPEIRVISYE